MTPHSSRPPFARGIRPASAAAAAARPAPLPPALILFSVAPEIAAECERIAGELRLARAEVKHLQAACIALKTHPRAMLVAASTIRSWDREIVEEHAARAGVPLRWVGVNHDPEDVAAEVRTWATDVLRRARTIR